MEAVNGEEKGGPPPPSPLTGCYLLVVIGEPHCNEHKDIILQRVAKGLLSWDLNDCLVDLEKELAIITEQALEGEEARYGERLIQFASENLVTEILIHPVVSTLAQCVRNLLSSFTRHRHIIHAGYTFANNGSWVLQDGTFSVADFSEAFQELEVLRVIRAYENGISVDVHCAPEGDWPRLPKEPFTRGCRVRLNPTDVLTSGSPAITAFISYLEPFLVPAELESVLESSDVVGNIRFSRPTLYVFPGGQGDAALFGINGFNMLLDGGFSRKACFWDFVRHLDRLDAVLLTRLNNGNINGIGSVLRRKRQNAVYPQIGHFFCNIQERKAILSPDGDKDKDPLLINLLDEGQELVSNLRHLNLTPQVCYRDSEPINLYHKVGHGTLDMYVLSPAKDSKDVREFLQKWNNNDQKLFANQKTNKDFVFPLQNLVSICALLVWQPANPEDTITRILFPGSSPQNKIFEGLDRIKSLEFIKHPVCSEKSLAPTSIIKSKQSVLDKIIPPEKKIIDNKKEKPKPPADNIEAEIKNGEVNGVQPEKTAPPVKKSDSTESEKSITKQKKPAENGEKPKPKPKQEAKPKPRSDSQQRKIKSADKKPSPTTPKKSVEKINGEAKPKPKASPTATPAKSAKEANNRKVVESKIKREPLSKREAPKPPVEKKEVKTERKPISRRPKDISKLSGSPSKKVNGVQKPDSIRRGKLDKEGTTDSSTVSTPSADQESVLKKDISKMTTDELQNLKAQELADLKEEQEAVKEIEAVFRKGELQEDKASDFRKVKDISIDDKLENEEYLIIEKTEIEQDLEPNKEEETQKIARDSEESEKQRKLSGEMTGKEVEDKRVEIQDEVQKIITSATDIVKAKDEAVEASKEVSVTSPEDKIDVSTDKKDIENEIKEVAQESQPDEKGSGNIESGATTTAPTLPEDERMPLDEIKEDNGDQIIEEKHVKEDTKEKDVPVIQLPPKTFENISKLPPVVGIRLDKQSHIRDIVKTPDEVADLPVHEEVDIDHYDEYPTSTETKAEPEEAKKEEIEKVEAKQEEERKVDKKTEDLKVEDKGDKEVKSEGKAKTDVEVKKEKMVEGKEVEDKVKDDKAVISEDLNKKELSKSPDEEKDTDERELELKNKEIKESKAIPVEIEVKTPEVKKEEHAKSEETKETPKEKEIKETATKVAESVKEELSTPESAKKKFVEKSETEVKEKETEKKEDVKQVESKKVEDKKEKVTENDISEALPEVPKEEIKIEKELKESKKPADKKIELVKEDISTIQKLDEKLQILKEEVKEVVEEIKKPVVEIAGLTKEDMKLVKEDAAAIQKMDDKLQKLKDGVAIGEVVTHKAEEPQHAEPVIITTDSNPDSPMIDEKPFDDKMELGRKSPKEREEDVAKIVASVAEVLKSDAPLEEFEGKIPFGVPYKSYTTELRETHITTVESPEKDEGKSIRTAKEIVSPKTSTVYFIEEERKIAPIHEEPEIQESKISKMIKDSNELMQATSKMIHDIKQAKTDPTDEEEVKEEPDVDAGTVHRMLVTTSSEDGGEEIEICPPGTITFSRSSESSGRSSPDVQSQKLSQKSSTADTFSDGTVITKAVTKELQRVDDTAKVLDESKKVLEDINKGDDIKDTKPVIDKPICDTENLVKDVDSVSKELLEKTVDVAKDVSEKLKKTTTDVDIKEEVKGVPEPVVSKVEDTKKAEEPKEKAEESKELKSEAKLKDEKSSESVGDVKKDTDVKKADEVSDKQDIKDKANIGQIKKDPKTEEIPGEKKVEVKDTKSTPVISVETAKEEREDDKKTEKEIEIKTKYAEESVVKDTEASVKAESRDEELSHGEAVKENKDPDELKATVVIKESTKEGDKSEDVTKGVKGTTNKESPKKEVKDVKFEDVTEEIKKTKNEESPKKELKEEAKAETEITKKEVAKVETKTDTTKEKIEESKKPDEKKEEIKIEATEDELSYAEAVKEGKDPEKLKAKVVIKENKTIEDEIKSDTQDDKKEKEPVIGEIKEFKETVLKDTEAAIEGVKEKIKDIKEDAKIQMEEMKKDVTEQSAILENIVNDIGESAAKDTSKVAEDARKEVEGIKDLAKSKVEEAKDDITKKKDTVLSAVDDFKKSVLTDAGQSIEKVIADTSKEKEKVLDATRDFKDTAIKETKKIVGTLKDDVKEAKDIIETKLEGIKEIVAEQKAALIGVVKDAKETISKDVETKVEEAKKEVTDTKDAMKAEIDDTCKKAVEKVDEKAEEIKKNVDTSKEDAKDFIQESNKILEDTKEKIIEQTSSQVKDVESKAEAVIQNIKDKSEDLKKDVSDEVKVLEDKFTEKKDEAIEKVDQLAKDLSKVGSDLKETVAGAISEVPFVKKDVSKDKAIKHSDEEDKSKYALHNGLETVEKMVVDVLTADREDATLTSDQKQVSITIDKAKEDIEKVVKKSDSEAKGFIEESKEMITSIFMGDSGNDEKEEILEKAAHDIEENFNIVSDMAKSVVFEKCEKPADEEHKKDEKILEKSAQSIEKDYEAVSDMAKSIIFEKCEKPTEMTESMVFEKCEKPAQKDQKEIEDISSLQKDTPKSEEKHKTEEAKHTTKKEETVVEKLEETLSKAAEETKDIVSFALKKDSVKEESPVKLSGKSTPDLGDEIPSKASGKSSPALSGDLKDIAKESSGKSTPELKDSSHIKVDNQDSLLSGKSSPGLSGKSSPVLSESLSPGAKAESKDSLLSGKSSPALSGEMKDGKESGKASPEPPKAESEVKDKPKSGEASPAVSGKATPESPKPSEVKEKCEAPTPSAISGKSTPEPAKPESKPSEVKEKSEAVTTSAKSSPAISGKATPESTKSEKVDDKLITDASGKSSPAVSGKASPLLGEIDSGKSTPDLKSKESEVSTVKIVTESIVDDKREQAKVTKDEEKREETKDKDVKVTEGEKKTESKDIKEESPKKNDVTGKKSEDLGVQEPTEKKLSISDVQISIKLAEEDVPKSESPEDTKPETKDVDSIDSGIDTEVDTKSKKSEESEEGKSTKQDSIPGPSVSPAKSSTEDLHLSGKSTPDIADVEKMKEMQETLKHEKHIPGSSTPPTVPVSPIVKEISAEEVKARSSAVAATKDGELRSCTPGSDDYEVGASTHSDVSSGQASRAPHLPESERIESDEDDDDVPGSPMSVTSQVAHSRSSSRYDFEDDRIGTKMDPMNTSFYGALPDEGELDFEKALAQHRQARGGDLVASGEESSTYLYEITRAKYSSPEPSQLDQINKNGSSGSFVGDLPAMTAAETKKDLLDSWGKPLGLPSPAPPNDNKGTPKKERKLPANVSAKNKLNDDRKRSESPSKYRNKKYSPVYVDLTYVPHHGNAYYSYVDFFKRVRARYYVFSGIEPSREVYNALLEAKQTWEDKELEVTIIPTYDTDILGYWVAENEELLTKCKIDLSPSASRCTINLQDHETSCSAYRLEF